MTFKHSASRSVALASAFVLALAAGCPPTPLDPGEDQSSPVDRRPAGGRGQGPAIAGNFNRNEGTVPGGSGDQDPDSSTDEQASGDAASAGQDPAATNANADGNPNQDGSSTSSSNVNGASESTVDSDGDGVSDSSDVCAGHDDLVDSDRDGAPDGCDECAAGDDRIDSDRDGIPDACDAPVNPWGDDVLLVDLDEDGVAEFEGDLSDGEPLNDLSWAHNVNVACWTALLDEYFVGNHVFYALRGVQPGHSILYIEVTPDSDVDVSLYAYTQATTEYPVPPDVSRANCEADHAPYSGPNPGETEDVEFHNPTNNSYNIFFAVAGGRTSDTSGSFRVKVRLISAY